jgi:ribonuclease Z
MVLDVALVGTGGVMPLPRRWLASVLIRYQSHLVLFDCGEATQISLQALGWGIKAIDLMLISHVHGDHVAGLPGLLLTQGNSGRTAPLDILGPPGLTEVVDRLRVIAPLLPFDVRCHEFAADDIFTLDALRVTSAAADHHVPCLAYRLEVPRGREFLPENARRLGVPIEHWRALQREEVVDWGGRLVTPEEVLGPPRRGLTVALVTDSRPTPELERIARHVDLLVCEANYGADDDLPKAIENKHMTFSEAARLARNATARQLVLTHFSPAITDPTVYADRATSIFPNTVIGRDHLTLSLSYPS